MGEWLLLALAPVFLACVAWEAWYWRKRRPGLYTLRDTLSNAALALMHQGADALAWAAVIGAYWWVHQFRVFDLTASWMSVALLFVAQDFAYYWWHRLSHRVRWMWASHVTHHSSERLNLSTAFRQSITYPVSGMSLFWLPLAWIGFSPTHIVAVVAINLAFQFFVHTQAVGRLWRPLEWLLNTPSHHRVHHGRNPQYIDRNYGGVLILYDRLFGTFAEEDEPVEYGITRPVRSFNPLWLNLHEWVDLARDVAQPGPLLQRLRHLWMPPEWQRPETAADRTGEPQRS